MKRFLWNLLPDSNFKRNRCGGFWTHYQTSLPMPSVWHQSETKPGRLPCQMGAVLHYENHGPIRIKLHE